METQTNEIELPEIVREPEGITGRQRKALQKLDSFKITRIDIFENYQQAQFHTKLFQIASE